MLELQPLLARTLSHLNTVYHLVRAEQRALVARKKTLSERFFRQRMGSLARHAAAIAEVMRISRHIGDLFAWFWYQNDRDLLQQQLAAQPGKDFPVHLGGAGELAFIERHQRLENRFVLYHGITSILRIGDISLIELLPGGPRIHSLAELKTQRQWQDNLRVWVIGHRPRKDQRQEPAAPPQLTTETADPQRLLRQLRRMAQTSIALPVDGQFNRTARTYFDQLEKLARLFSRRKLGACVRASEGLGLVALLHHRRRSLAAMLLHPHPLVPQKLDPGCFELARQIISGSPAAPPEIYLDPLDFSVDARWVPAFWVGLSAELVWDVIVGKAAVWSIYSPAYLIEKLRAAGFRVERGPNGWYMLTYDLPGLKMSTPDISQVLVAIRRRLLREESAVELMIEPASKIAAGEIRPFMGLAICLRQFIGAVAPSP
jgi:hypothetical protein